MERRTLQADAASLAVVVVGFEVKPPSGGGAGCGASWRLSDASRGSFGEVVPDEAVGDPENMVIRGDVALVLTDD